MMLVLKTPPPPVFVFRIVIDQSISSWISTQAEASLGLRACWSKMLFDNQRRELAGIQPLVKAGCRTFSIHPRWRGCRLSACLSFMFTACTENVTHVKDLIRVHLLIRDGLAAGAMETLRCFEKAAWQSIRWFRLLLQGDGIGFSVTAHFLALHCTVADCNVFLCNEALLPAFSSTCNPVTHGHCQVTFLLIFWMEFVTFFGAASYFIFENQDFFFFSPVIEEGAVLLVVWNQFLSNVWLAMVSLLALL